MESLLELARAATKCDPITEQAIRNPGVQGVVLDIDEVGLRLWYASHILDGHDLNDLAVRVARLLDPSGRRRPGLWPIETELLALDDWPPYRVPAAPLDLWWRAAILGRRPG